jgi:hypothetical protein
VSENIDQTEVMISRSGIDNASNTWLAHIRPCKGMKHCSTNLLQLRASTLISHSLMTRSLLEGERPASGSTQAGSWSQTPTTEPSLVWGCGVDRRGDEEACCARRPWCICSIHWPERLEGKTMEEGSTVHEICWDQRHVVVFEQLKSRYR